MKIGVITVQDSANYGSFLQAYALKLALEDLGHEVEFIKTRDESEVKKVYFGRKRLSKHYLLNYVKNLKKYKVFLEDRKLLKELEIEKVTKDTYDCVVIGSDELWNVCTPHFKSSFFYGDQVPAKRIVAYAISCGKATKDDFEQLPALKKSINEIDEILVRDEATRQLVLDFTGKECDRVCDPTFLVDVKRMTKTYECPIKDKFILVYAYILDEKIIEYITRYAKENNYKLVAACMQQSWCDYNIMCSPLEFSNLIQCAEVVVTATFHGSIFSFLNKSRFVSFAKLSKVRDVLKYVGLEDAIIEEQCSYEIFKDKMEQNYDYANVEKVILEYREYSLERLQKEINNK